MEGEESGDRLSVRAIPSPGRLSLIAAPYRACIRSAHGRPPSPTGRGSRAESARGEGIAHTETDFLYFPMLKVTVTVVTTSIGWPFSKVGWYRH